ncbi:MAG: hypothetical protein ACE366_21630 [Bradymonadia bacterium]
MKKRDIRTATTTVTTTEQITEHVTEQVDVEPLTAEEERVLRMRSGVSVPDDAPLHNKLDTIENPLARADAAERIRLIEYMAMEEIKARMAAVEARPSVNEARKQRIVSALQKKD